jgi:hypothetical protein
MEWRLASNLHCLLSYTTAQLRFRQKNDRKRRTGLLGTAMAARWGLRGKSVVALLLACVLALVPAVLLGWKAMEDIRTHFGLAYAKNFTLLNQQKILAPVIRELSLSRRLAESVVTQDWLLDEGDSERRTRFFREVEGYRSDQQNDYSYFVIVDASHHYYFNDSTAPLSNAPR